MTTQTTRWSPDTCQCELEYTWDDSVSETNRVHNFKSISKCSVHSAQADQTAYNTVFEENPRKNITRQLCLDNGPAALFDTIDGVRQFKNGISYNFSWSGVAPNRVLTISFTGITLTTQQRTTIQNVLNNRFGAGKVTIV